MGLWQTALDLIYPPGCAICDAETAERGGLCGACWRETRFIRGCACSLCAAPLPGEAEDDAMCDECLATPRPWSAGRAALVYSGSGRRLVLKIKHGDRLDLLAPAARWMVAAAEGFWPADPLLVPVPCHWSRRVRRRYDQAGLLARAVARETGHELGPRALVRRIATPVLDGIGREERFDTLDGVFAMHSRHGDLRDRNVVLIDDVMTSGATFDAATRVVTAAGARDVRVLALARVARDA